MSGPEVLRVETDSAAGLAFTTRREGVSTGGFASLNLGASTGDTAAAVRDNRLAVCEHLGIPADRVSMCRQIHGARVHEVARPLRRGRFAGGLVGWPHGDALVARAGALPLAVLGADCLPILMWRRDEPGVAATHAGWRGLVGGVVEATVEALGQPAHVGVAIGPGIGPARYEVSQELADRFAARFGARVVRKRHVDLAGAARLALMGSGVPTAHIQTIDACTYDEPDRWFSHRRDGPGCGRQAGLIWLEDA